MNNIIVLSVLAFVTACGGIVQEHDRFDADGGAPDARPVPTVVSHPAEEVSGTPVSVKPRGAK